MNGGVKLYTSAIADDLATSIGMQNFAWKFASYLESLFRTTGRGQPLAGIVATFDAKSGKPFERPMSFILDLEDMSIGEPDTHDPRQDRAAAFMKAFIHTNKAIGVITAFEAWQSNTPGLLPREDPQRTEALFVMAEHIRFQTPFVLISAITRDAEGKGIAAPFVPKQGGGMKTTGRFSNLLDRTRFS